VNQYPGSTVPSELNPRVSPKLRGNRQTLAQPSFRDQSPNALNFGPGRRNGLVVDREARLW